MTAGSESRRGRARVSRRIRLRVAPEGPGSDTPRGAAAGARWPAALHAPATAWLDRTLAAMRRAAFVAARIRRDAARPWKMNPAHRTSSSLAGLTGMS